ncbi:hydrogenase nickel incorporation protein HypB [Marinobacterium lutimaris]|uniref:Hydrogenase maturation factor HypB n=1 Tax=Marinobacterium lutimaris TaxID=568106 RepID=A0A1H5YVA0_9GAMM|nr:hydrogenase nickel incorporation protein HypB [Marinobacterium lutimaris]SEG27938.1 Hydrogenase nickel incorporation protein HypB [Marinobacterium lutimaris]
MCTVCGCAEGETRIEGDHHHHEHAHAHSHAAGHDHSHPHDHSHEHSHQHADADTSPLVAEGMNLHYGQGAAHAHAPGLSQGRMVQIEQDILGKNDRYAAQNRARFAAASLFALNLVSSPGSGKTTLLTRTIEMFGERLPLAVIEGDQQTANDADRIRATGARAIQINTGKGCHLDAHMIGHALERLGELEGGVLFIENVGNLVCPAAFDLGEAHKVAILSVTEGEDKPLKYPDMFHAADLMLLNKTDLLPHLDFDVEACIDYARRVNPNIEVLQVSARSGEGMAEWLDWIEARREARIRDRINALKQQAQALEALL